MMEIIAEREEDKARMGRQRVKGRQRRQVGSQA